MIKIVAVILAVSLTILLVGCGETVQKHTPDEQGCIEAYVWDRVQGRFVRRFMCECS